MQKQTGEWGYRCKLDGGCSEVMLDTTMESYVTKPCEDVISSGDPYMINETRTSAAP